MTTRRGFLAALVALCGGSALAGGRYCCTERDNLAKGVQAAHRSLTEDPPRPLTATRQLEEAARAANVELEQRRHDP